MSAVIILSCDMLDTSASADRHCNVVIIHLMYNMPLVFGGFSDSYKI